jgi:Pvc16 N-terminal domain/Carboxypeptidase regulatory-like domain
VVTVLADVDLVVRALFRARMSTLRNAAGIVAEGQIGIQPPDNLWISDVNGFTPPKGLNVYLADVRENRKLRTNERIDRPPVNGVVFRDPAPSRFDCHYLISAWSGSTDRKAKTIDEHKILAEALKVLVEERAIAVGGVDLPTSIAPPEGFPKLAEFWGTMGDKHRWKPAIELVVTVPVEERSEPAGPEVTTRFAEYRHGTDAVSAELRIQIAGVVRDRTFTPPIVVERAWIQLEDTAGKPLGTARTDEKGHFTFTDVSPGTYQLRLRAEGRTEPQVTPITVPSPSGRYDLEFP